MSPWKLSLIKTTRIHRKILAPLEVNVKVDLTSYYRKSTTLQYLMYITMRYKSLNLRPIIHCIQTPYEFTFISTSQDYFSNH